MSTTTIEGIEVRIAENNEYPRILWQINNNTIIPLAANEVNSVNNNNIGIYVKQQGKYYFVPKHVSIQKLTKNLSNYAENNIQDYKNISQFSQNTIYDLTNIKVIDAPDAFAYCTNLQSIPQSLVNTWDTSELSDCSGMFRYCESLITIPEIYIGDAINTSAMFSGCSSLTTLPYLDTKCSLKVDGMFAYCTSLPQNFPWILDCRSFNNVSFEGTADFFAGLLEGSSVENITICLSIPQQMIDIMNSNLSSAGLTFSSLINSQGNCNVEFVDEPEN